MKSKLLPELEGGEKALKAAKDDILYRITSHMEHMPMCCSVGLLNNMGANQYSDHTWTVMCTKSDSLDLDRIKGAKDIHSLIDRVNSMGKTVVFPKKVAVWAALSKILAKAKYGTDANGKGAYSGYKAAQIVLCDRINEDKRNKAFKFSTYDIVFSVDDLINWLDKEGRDLCEVLVSEAVPGGHGARVRSCIVRPYQNKLEDYLAPHLTELKEYLLEYNDMTFGDNEEVKAVDKISAMW